MILETISALLGILVVYHMHRSLSYQHDFIGDLARNVLHTVRGGAERLKMPSASQLFIHPSYTGVNTRRVASDGMHLPSEYDVVGPKKTNGVSLAEMTPPMGMPMGLPRAPNAIAPDTSMGQVASPQNAQQMFEPAPFNAGSEFESWSS